MSDAPTVVVEHLPSEGFEYVQELDADSEWRTKYGFKYVTCRELNVYLPCKVTVTVPIGFLCDGCTCGISKFGQPEWLIHDWLYASAGQGGARKITRSEADDIFWVWPQFHRWLAVRCIGGLFWSKQPVGFDSRIQVQLVK